MSKETIPLLKLANEALRDANDDLRKVHKEREEKLYSELKHEFRKVSELEEKLSDRVYYRNRYFNLKSLYRAKGNGKFWQGWFIGVGGFTVGALIISLIF